MDFELIIFVDKPYEEIIQQNLESIIQNAKPEMKISIKVQKIKKNVAILLKTNVDCNFKALAKIIFDAILVN